MKTVADGLGAIGENDSARHAVEIIGGVGIALYGLNKAIVISKAIRASEIGTLIAGTATREANTAAIVAEGRAATLTAEVFLLS
jgi:hypothetical protein